MSEPGFLFLTKAMCRPLEQTEQNPKRLILQLDQNAAFAKFTRRGIGFGCPKWTIAFVGPSTKSFPSDQPSSSWRNYTTKL